MLFQKYETTIDAMLNNAHKIMREAIETYKPIAIFAAFSGGNDSIVSTHFACENYGAAAIHADTQIGIQKSHQHARDTAKRYGWHYLEKSPKPEGMPDIHRDGTPFLKSDLPTGEWIDGNTSYEEFCLNFGMPGPGQHPRMYQRLKERVFDAFKREAKAGQHRNSCVMFVSGIRHDESAIRAGYQRAVQKVKFSVWVNPFYWQNKHDFELYRQEFGLPRNRVSDTIGISGECLCGTMGDRSELEGIKKIEPETAAYIQSIEARCELLGLHCQWATTPAPTERVIKCMANQLSLFGEGSTFQPACVGCMRRRRQ